MGLLHTERWNNTGLFIWWFDIFTLKGKKRQTLRRAIVTQKLLSNKSGFQCWVYPGFIKCHLKCKIPQNEVSADTPDNQLWCFFVELKVCSVLLDNKGSEYFCKIEILSATPHSSFPIPTAIPSLKTKKRKKREIKHWITAWPCDGPWLIAYTFSVPVLLCAHHSGSSS